MTDELKQWEYDKGYDKGKADGARDFAELLDNDADIGIYDYYGNKISAIDLLAEWQKGKNNEP